MKNLLEKLERDLSEAREQIRRRDQLRRRLQLVEIDLRAERKRLEPFRETLKQEEADVRRLEGLSLPGLFAAILGNKEKQLARERQEALAARLRFDEASFAVEALVEEERLCRQQLESVAHAERRYAEALDRKETLLRSEGREAAARIVEISNRVGGSRADFKELEEARTAGLRARSSLNLVITHLQKAENWGSWDLWGGGMVSTAAKHHNLDQARSHAHTAQHHLRAFHHELEDVGQRLSTSLQMGNFLKFADWFFDGLIADWLVQRKIQDSLAGAQRALTEVRRSLDKVEERMTEARDRLARAEQERREFLEQA